MPDSWGPSHRRMRLTALELDTSWTPVISNNLLEPPHLVDRNVEWSSAQDLPVLSTESTVSDVAHHALKHVIVWNGLPAGTVSFS